MALEAIKISKCIDRFKEYCHKSKKWTVYEGEDLVQVGNSYHKFAWVRSVQPTTFQSIVMNPISAIRQGVMYRIVKISFMAWVLPETPSATILELFEENPTFLKWVALYDFGRISGDLPCCSRLNETKSVVFQEFERFLGNCYGIEFEPLFKAETVDHQTRGSGLRLIGTKIFG